MAPWKTIFHYKQVVPSISMLFSGRVNVLRFFIASRKVAPPVRMALSAEPTPVGGPCSGPVGVASTVPSVVPGDQTREGF